VVAANAATDFAPHIIINMVYRRPTLYRLRPYRRRVATRGRTRVTIRPTRLPARYRQVDRMPRVAHRGRRFGRGAF